MLALLSAVGLMEQEAQRKQVTGKRTAMGLKEGCNSGAGVQLGGRPLAQDAQGKVQRPCPPVRVLFTSLYSTIHSFALSCSACSQEWGRIFLCLLPPSKQPSHRRLFLDFDEIAKMGYVVVRTLFLWTGNWGKFLPPSLLWNVHNLSGDQEHPCVSTCQDKGSVWICLLGQGYS